MQFLNTSTGHIEGYRWHFGDFDPATGQPITSTQVSPTHTYRTAGVYTVTLTVSGPSVSRSLTKPHYITITEPVSAGFYAQPLTGTAPLTVTFTSTTTGASSQVWHYGDGVTQTITASAFIPSTSSGQSLPSYAITHTYTGPGVYTVTQWAEGPEGRDALTRTRYLTVTRAVTASFGVFPSQGIAPLLVQFLNTSTGEIDAYRWHFGDPAAAAGAITSTLPSPTHTYGRGGVYTVSLTISGPQGSDSLTRSGLITVTEAVVVSVADSDGVAEAGLRVYVYDGTRYTGLNGTTDAAGQVVFSPASGSYRFRVDKTGTQFWSGPANHCAVPGSTTVVADA